VPEKPLRAETITDVVAEAPGSKGPILFGFKEMVKSTALRETVNE
jgi:hypothetical protein